MPVRNFAILGAVAIVAGAISAGAIQAAEKSLLWVQPMKDHPVHQLMQAGFLSKCGELGYACEVVGNASASVWDVPGSLPLAEAALSRTEFCAVAVYGPGPDLYPYITKLGSQGIPVVTWHVLPAEGSIPGLKAAVGEDIAGAGANAAVAMGEKLGGKGSIALTQGSINETENVMADSFRATIAEQFPEITVLETQLEGFEPSAAAAKAVGILQADEAIVGAFSTTGNGIQTWSNAARKAGRDLTIIGMDYIRQNLDIIKAGDAYGLVAQPLFEEGAASAELAANLCEGKEVAYLNPLPAEVVTADSLDKYYAILDGAGQ